MSESDPTALRPVRWPIYLVVGVVVLALLARAATLVGLLGGGSPPPAVSAAEEGETWSFRRLLDHLHSCDVRLAIVTTQERGQGGPRVTVCRESDQAGSDAAVVHIQRRSSADDAGGRAGAGSFSWGRFLFTGDEGLLTDVRNALP